MSEELLSIVVPIYNTRRYLDTCVRSILKQTYSNLEIVLVDDGSTDGSGEMCDKYAAHDSRVKVLHQVNQGVSVARKRGVRETSGKYIGFVDSDDYIDENWYQELMSCKENYDLVIADWWREDKTHTRHAGDMIKPGVYSSVKAMDFLSAHLINASSPGGKMNIQPGLASYMWNKLFKAKITKPVIEECNINLSLWEDHEFFCRYFLRCRSVLVTDICGYHYRVREGAARRRKSRDCRVLRTACEFYETLSRVFEDDPRRDILMPQLQVKMAAIMTGIPAKMGFVPRAQLQMKTMIFPFINQLEGKRIALYGAGMLGKNYEYQIRNWNICEIALWVDYNWTGYIRIGMDVSPVDRLKDIDFDYIVIATRKSKDADTIRKRLSLLGIEEAKIIWKPPLEV